MTTILQGLLALIAFLLPFEVRRPVLSFTPYMVFTDLEVVTLLVIGVWAIRSAVRRQLPTLPGGLAVIIWTLVGVALLSAAAAPDFRFASLKFTLRLLTGVLFLYAVFTGCTGCTGYAGYPPSLRLRSGQACISCISLLSRFLIAGAAVSSAAGIWTCLRPDQAAWLVPLFREREFLIGNSVRLSGTFEYPNIAAAFLEMAFVLSLAPQQASLSGKVNRMHRIYGIFRIPPILHILSIPVKSLLWAAAQGLILTGAVMTLSRAGLVAALFGLCLVVALHVDRYYRMRRMGGMDRMPSILPILFIPVKPFLPTLAATALCLAGVLALYPPFSLRFWTGGDQAWYSARYEALDVPPLFAGGASTAQVRVTNTGQIPWSPKGEHPFRLSYHWLEAGTGKAIPAPQARTELPGEIGPGASVMLTAAVYAPAAPGDYLIAWDMVHEKATWFSQKGCPPRTVPCRVIEATGEQGLIAAGNAEVPPDPTALEAESVSRTTLWKAGWAMFRRHPILGVGPDNFRRLWGREFGMDRWDERVHANNLFIEVLATTGILGGLAFLALVVSVLRMQVRSLRRCAPDDHARFSAMAALFGTTVVFLVHGLVDCFLAFTPIYLLFWMIVGLSAGMTNYRRR